MNPELEELASRYVLDQLDDRERAEFEARLIASTELTARVRELESAYAQVVRGLPRYEPPGDLLDSIEARIHDQPGVRQRLASPNRMRRWRLVAGWGIAAVIAVSVSTIAIQSLRRETRPLVLVVGLDSSRSTLAQLHVGERGADSDARFIQLASLAEKYWKNPDDLPVALAAADHGGRAYAVFDPESNQGFIGIQHLPAPKPGTQYHVWIVDTATHRVREAGILPIEGAQDGLFSFSITPVGREKSERLQFFVTAEENANGLTKTPRGRVVLGRREI
ncbi:anti-sigma-K factor rskA [mine drainage metagenome]|uniref:Anti-sigma-K factor rskA n=1 Tax=mine drainage metagenome TaxID=410659 RepID=A0A1J5TDI5_9ZZZZ